MRNALFVERLLKQGWMVLQNARTGTRRKNQHRTTVFLLMNQAGLITRKGLIRKVS